MTDSDRIAELISQLREHDRVVHELASKHVPPAILPSDLTLRQMQVLFVVRAQPGITGQELSEHLQVSTPTISGLVDRLAGKGLLVRQPDPDDRRRVLLALTDTAQAMLSEMESLGAQVRDEVLTRLTVQELESLVTLSGRIRQIAEDLLSERG